MLFASGASIAASAFVLFLTKTVSAQQQGDGGSVWGGINITDAALMIRDAISSPTCNVTENCVTFKNTVVPLCLNLRGEAGCWCGNHNPLHYCALCMSNPTDNSTNPDQTQAATTGHGNYHRACGAYGTFLNSTGASITSSSLSTGTAGASSAGSSSSSHTGAIVGGVVGGIVGLAIIAGIIFLLYRRMKHKEQRNASGTSVYSEPKYGNAGPPSSVGSPPPQMGQTPPPPFNPYVMPPHSPAYTNSVGYTSRDSAAPTEYDTSMLKHLEPPTSIGYSRTAEPMS